MPKGRPKIGPVKKLGTLAIRLDDAERAAIDARAESLGKKTSTHARDVLLADAALLTPAAKPAKRRKA